jgi:hypothetical protein
MPDPFGSAMFESRPMPPYFGILAVDAKDSTALPSIQHAALSRAITEIVHRGLEQAGLKDMRRQFESNTGDGLAFGFDPSWVPSIICPFAEVLNTLLKRHNAGVGPRVRLRMSVHIGPVPLAPGRPGDGNAAARSETHRLLDSEALRACLDRADPDATPLVVIVSDTVHRAAVLGGYCALPPSRFTEVRAEVPGKGFSQPAWIHVPSPSGKLIGAIGEHPGAPPAPAAGGDGSSRVEPRPVPIRSQHVEFGFAVMDSTLRDVHHHTAPRQGPDRL